MRAVLAPLEPGREHLHRPDTFRSAPKDRDVYDLAILRTLQASRIGIMPTRQVYCTTCMEDVSWR